MHVNPRLARCVAFITFALGLASLGGCADAARWGTERYDRNQMDAWLDNPEQGALVLGEFPLKKKAIIDGDTVKVGGLDASLRLLGIDTEETFKKDADFRKYEVGWEKYLANEAAKTNRPVKIATPVGMDGKYYAQHFFEGMYRVKLERDHPKEVRGRFNRYLAYVFGKNEEGEWVNYNVESVRVGMSPYFTKYGYSRRFHDDFVQAEQEAREAKVGIWEPGAEHYPDYDVRIRWWHGRAAFVEQFERDAEGREDMVVLTHWDAVNRLEQMIGEEVTVLATLGSIKKYDNGPTKVTLARRMFADFPIMFFDDQVLEDAQVEKYKGEYVRVRGMVNVYKRRDGSEELQMVIRNPRQIQTPNYYIPGVQEEVGPLGPAMPQGHTLPVLGRVEWEGGTEAPAQPEPVPEPAPEPVPEPDPQSGDETGAVAESPAPNDDAQATDPALEAANTEASATGTTGE